MLPGVSFLALHLSPRMPEVVGAVATAQCRSLNLRTTAAGPESGCRTVPTWRFSAVAVAVAVGRQQAGWHQAVGGIPPDGTTATFPAPMVLGLLNRTRGYSFTGVTGGAAIVAEGILGASGVALIVFSALSPAQPGPARSSSARFSPARSSSAPPKPATLAPAAPFWRALAVPHNDGYPGGHPVDRTVDRTVDIAVDNFVDESSSSTEARAVPADTGRVWSYRLQGIAGPSLVCFT